MFRCLEGGRLGICLLAVKTALLRTTFILTHRGCKSPATRKKEQTPSSPPGSLPCVGQVLKSKGPWSLAAWIWPLLPQFSVCLPLSFLSYCSQHVLVRSPNSPGSNIPFLHNLQSTFCLQHREVISSPFLRVATVVLVSGP